jgi:uncharacterized oligopeptide transporter (OPT) family protein
MPAPQAQMVAGSISGFSQPLAFCIGFLISFIWIVLENATKRKAQILPMVFGIGLFLGMVFGLLLAIGGIIRYVSDKKKAGVFAASGIILAAGVMGGEGIAGFGLKAMNVAGFPSLISDGLLFGVFIFVLLASLVSWKKMVKPRDNK